MVFNWLSKVIIAPLSQPIRSKTKSESCFARTRFPSLGANYIYLLRILIRSLCCLHLLRLARVITLVLVLRHSIGNRSKSLSSEENVLQLMNLILCIAIYTLDKVIHSLNNRGLYYTVLQCALSILISISPGIGDMFLMYYDFVYCCFLLLNLFTA